MDFLLFFKAIIIGIVEGITEFLPISSTGHMIIIGDFIRFNPPSVSKEYTDLFEVVIQLGAILAIVILYWEKIRDSVVNFRSYGFKLWTNIIIAFIPSAVIGLLLHSIIKKYLFGSSTVIVAMILGGFLLLYMEKRYRKSDIIKNIDDITPGQALKIGIFQCLSLWPGMSRSASTIMGGWVSGLSNVAAAEFSFFLAIPTMLAASGLEIVQAISKNSVAFTSPNLIALVIGFVVSFLVAMVVVDKFIGFLKNKPMRVFAIYRIFVGLLLFVLAISNVIAFN